MFSDGEPKPVAGLDAALKKANESESKSCTNVVVLPNGNGFESYLLSEGYLPEIEQAIDELEGKSKSLDAYMKRMQGQKIKGGKARDYNLPGGREIAAKDYLERNKTSAARSVALAISSKQGSKQCIPSKIEELFQFMSNAQGLPKARRETK